MENQLKTKSPVPCDRRVMQIQQGSNIQFPYVVEFKNLQNLSDKKYVGLGVRQTDSPIF